MKNNRKDIGLEDFARAISLLTFELGRYIESAPLLTPSQEALLTLLEQRRKLSLKEIKTFLPVNTYQLSRLVASLENFIENRRTIPLVLREVNSHDKRQWLISLLPEGRRVLLTEWRRRKKRLGTLLSPLSLEEKDMFMDILDKMLSFMQSK